MVRRAILSALPFVPEEKSLTNLREAAKKCRGCDLYRQAVQTVFGQGRERAALMLVGEQPGDEEDKAGRPFIGPAGRLLDLCMKEAGIDREIAYVTNAVKHFKWEPRGKRRLHKKPTIQEVRACHPWLMAEIEAVRPELIVCLGATAAQSLLGPQFRVLLNRGKMIERPGLPPLLVTVHPSSILRAQHEDRELERRLFIEDLTVAAKALRG